MLKIYFVRHGETLWNTLKIFQGKSNSPLTELGINQAKKLCNYLKDIKFDKIYSSNLQRALDTANLIKGDRKLEILSLKEFQEINMGYVEGIPKEEFQKKYPIEYFNFWNDAKNYNPKAYCGESYEELILRVKKGLNKLISQNENKTILVVTHGVTLKAIFNIINNAGIEEFTNQPVPENTSFSVVEYDNSKFKILDFSNISHLK